MNIFVLALLTLLPEFPSICSQDPSSATCDDTKEYTYSNNCGRTCNDYQGSSSSCADLFRWDCFCKSNTFLRSDNQCVTADLCPQQAIAPDMSCNNGQQWYECDPNCGSTCSDYSTVSQQCTLACSAGCFCPEGLYLNSYGRCVTPAECTDSTDTSLTMPDCMAGQQYLSCDPNCGRTCQTKDDIPSDDCSQDCFSGCYCPSGQFLNNDQQCVDPIDCQQDDSDSEDNDDV